MPVTKLIIGLSVNLVVPLVGVIAFLLLCRRMSQAQIQSPPFVPWFVLFATFGGWLMVALTAMFWEWSGMASLELFSLTLIAPFVTAAAAWNLRRRRAVSVFHKSAFIASVAYSTVITLVDLYWIGCVGIYGR